MSSSLQFPIERERELHLLSRKIRWMLNLVQVQHIFPPMFFFFDFSPFHLLQFKSSSRRLLQNLHTDNPGVFFLGKYIEDEWNFDEIPFLYPLLAKSNSYINYTLAFSPIFLYLIIQWLNSLKMTDKINNKCMNKRKPDVITEFETSIWTMTDRVKLICLWRRNALPLPGLLPLANFIIFMGPLRLIGSAMAVFDPAFCRKNLQEVSLTLQLDSVKPRGIGFES